MVYDVCTVKGPLPYRLDTLPLVQAYLVGDHMKQRRSPIQSTITDVRPAMYLRVSTREQADSGLGLAAQEARCSAQAIAKGWPTPTVYADEGISGTYGTERRPALAAMLAAIHADDINAVIVLDLSRLGRTVKLVTTLIEEFDQRGVAFVSCKESFDTSTAMGRAMMGLVAVFGQLERDLTSERTVAALAELDKQGKDKGGRLPYGYQRTPDGIVVDADAAVLVRYIFARRLAGDTLRDIATALNGRHHRSPRDGYWYASGVRDVLRNEPAYRGGTRGGSTIRWPSIL